MSSTEDNSRNLFCVRYTDVKCGHNFYINYVSDPSEKRSFKLPEEMLKLSLQPEGKADSTKEDAKAIANIDLKESILRYLIARHGEGMPSINLTEDGKDLVIDFHIFAGHTEALERLPFEEPKDGLVNAKWQFLSSTIMVLILRIDYVLGRKSIDGWAQMPKFDVAMLEDRARMAPGKKATIERISLAARMPPEGNETPEQAEYRLRKGLIPRWPIKVGDRLFSFGWSDEHMERTAYFNILVSDHPNSLTLPPPLVKIARSATRKEAHAIARNLTMADNMSLSTHLLSCVLKYHKHHKPQVYVSAENEKHLVFDVPFSIKHAPMFTKCFPGQGMMTGFCSIIFSCYWDYFEDKLGQPDDLERALNHHHIGAGEPKTTARKATQKHITSVLFRKRVPLSSSELLQHRDIVQSLMQNFSLMSDFDEMMKHMNINVPH